MSNADHSSDESMSNADHSSGDEYASEKMPAENSDSPQYSNDDTTDELKKLKDAVYFRVVWYIWKHQNGGHFGPFPTWWTVESKCENRIHIPEGFGLPPPMNERKMNNLIKAYEQFYEQSYQRKYPIMKHLERMSLGDLAEEIFQYWKNHFEGEGTWKLRDGTASWNNSEFHLWKADQQGGKKKNKTKKRKRKKKKTKRKNKRRKKTKRRRKKKKKTKRRRKNKPRKRK